MATAADFTPDAYALRTTDAVGRSHGGFQWPSEVGAVVTAPDWSSTPECGGGLHGLPDGLGDYALLDTDRDALWWVVGFVRAEAVDLNGKVKFPRCRVEYFGRMPGAMKLISTHCIKRMLELAKSDTATGDGGHAAATGDRGHAAATGYGGHAAATGDGGHAAATGHGGHAAATGDMGHAAATGDMGHAAATGHGGHAAATGYGGRVAATGDGGHAAATGYGGHAAATGYGGHAAATGHGGHAAVTGKNSVAVAVGGDGSASASLGGAIVLAAYNDAGDLVAVRGTLIGQNGVEPDVSYRLTTAGEFERAK